MTTSLQLPERLVVDLQKLKSYLLNLDHPRGKSKAKFFLGWGFRDSDLEILEAALRAHVMLDNLKDVTVTRWDTRFSFRGALTTPNGIAPRVFSAWGVDIGATEARFFTAHPY